MRKKLTGYDVGALLYCPANAHTSIADALVAQRFPTPFSLAFCPGGQRVQRRQHHPVAAG